MDDKYRSRKWLLSVFIQAVATIGLVFGKLSGADFATVSSANLVAYSFANAAQYMAERNK